MRPITLAPARLHGVVTLAVAALLVCMSFVAAPAAFAAAAAPVVDDQFERSVASGWGATPAGQQWTTSSPASTSVSSGSARVTAQPGGSTVQQLSGSTPRDITLSALVWPEATTSAGNGATVSFAVRAGGGSSYQARVRFGTSGVNLWMSRFDKTTAAEGTLVSTKPLTSYQVGQKVRVEFTVTGTSPVSLKARIWIDGTAKPTSWQQTFDDTATNRITQAGAVQVSTYLSSGSSANSMRIDQLQIADPVSAPPASPAPTPTPTTPPGPAPTTPPAPAPTTPPAPTPTSPDAAGSLPVGKATYPVPAGAVYAVAKGTRTGSGTVSDPYGSAAYAVEKAPNGSTIVLRGGTYREYVYVGFDRKLTVQSYPGEAVWFDGSSPVTGWTKSGSTWVANGWTHVFDHRISFNANADETNRFVDSRNPLAGYPDQVWINDVPLRQVASASTVTPGTFYVDEVGKRLVIGSDPSGKKVAASTIARAFKVQGKGTTLRGFGVQRYATTLNMMGTVTAEVDGITLENLVVRDNATVGIYTWNDNQTMRKVTATGNGMLGIGANGTDNLVIADSLVSGNNTQMFKPAPVSGGMKLSGINGARVLDNVVSDNDSAGIWFDVSSYDVQVIGNRVTDNTTTGVQVEISEKATIADNYISGNDFGVQISNSGTVKVWNNTIDGVKRAIAITHDARRQGSSALAASIPWTLRDITFRNNAISYSASGSCPILTQDYESKMLGNSFGVSLNNNVYHRQSVSAPSNFACWANGASGTRSFKTMADFSSFTGNDTRSAEWNGAAIVGSDLMLRADVVASPRATLAGLPTDVATAVGVKAGSTRLGPFSEPRR